MAMTTKDVSWRIDGIRVEAVIGRQIPTFERGRELSLTFQLEETDEDGVATTVVLGGTAGTTAGGPEGGTASATVETPASRREALLEFLEVAGSIEVARSDGGDVYVREFLSDAAPVDSRIVPLERGLDIDRARSAWVAIVGGTDVTEDPGPLRVQLDVVVLAALEEYDTRDDLVDELGSPITQL